MTKLQLRKFVYKKPSNLLENFGENKRLIDEIIIRKIKVWIINFAKMT